MLDDSWALLCLDDNEIDGKARKKKCDRGKEGMACAYVYILPITHEHPTHTAFDH